MNAGFVLQGLGRMRTLLVAMVFGSVLFGLPVVSGQRAMAQESPYLPVAEVMPEPVGGLGAIAKRVVYPEGAKKANVEGKVYVVAYINESGDVDDVKVIKGLAMGCDEAAAKAVKESKFSPGKQNGAAVKVQLSLPIVFKMTK